MPNDNVPQLNPADRENVLVNVLEDALSSKRVACRLPAFITLDPELWFSLVERSFAPSSVQENDERFTRVTNALDSRMTIAVRDVIVNPPRENAYLKTQIIKHLSSSQEQKTRRLLEMEEMGDRKVSQLLRHLQGLAGTSVPEYMLRTLWCGRLPFNVQAILAAQKDLSLERLADLANFISKLTESWRTVAAITPSTSETLIEQFKPQFVTMCEEIANFRGEVSEISSCEPRPREKSDIRSRSRSRSRGRYADKGVCWYHAKFGPQATKCTQPCTYNTGNAEDSH